MTRGFLCQKVNNYLERVYHPDRVLYPQRRIGKKGEGRFERISWPEAIREITTRTSSTSQLLGDGPASAFCRTAMPARWAS